MKKVKITISPMYNAIGVRLLLGEIGVIAPMLQEENTIITHMSEDQIHRFRNSKGAAHRIETIEPPAEPAPAPYLVEEFNSEDEAVAEDPVYSDGGEAA